MNIEYFAYMMAQLCPIAPPQMAVALSGGADSLALLYLLQGWAFSRNVILYPLIVDHQLRPCGTIEARQVSRWVQAWGLEACVIPWDHGPMTSGIMKKARQGRYQMLALHCHKRGIRHLCVAHHQDDVLETVLMRQERHSYWRGKAGISAIQYLYGLKILRPLLLFRKDQLIDLLHSIGQPWIEDSSNHDTRFTRTRVRQKVCALSLSERVSLLRQIDTYAHDRQKEAWHISQGYRVWGGHYLRMPWQNCTTEKGALIVKAFINYFVMHSVPLSWSFLMNLWEKIAQSFRGIFCAVPCVVATGGGCLFMRSKDNLFVLREPGRVSPWPSTIHQDFLWDHRFFCYPHSMACHGLTQGYLLQEGVKRASCQWIWPYIRATLPPAWEKILYCPCAPPYPHFAVLAKPG